MMAERRRWRNASCAATGPVAAGSPVTVTVSEPNAWVGVHSSGLQLSPEPSQLE
jgi:hypothetical protein